MAEYIQYGSFTKFNGELCYKCYKSQDDIESEIDEILNDSTTGGLTEEFILTLL